MSASQETTRVVKSYASPMDTPRLCRRCGTPLIGIPSRRTCSNACRQADWKQSQNVASLTVTISVDAIRGLDAIGRIHNMTRSEVLRDLIGSYVMAQAAAYEAAAALAAPPRHEASAAERFQVPERTPST